MMSKPQSRHPAGTVDAKGDPVGGRWKSAIPHPMPIKTLTFADLGDNELESATIYFNSQYRKMRAWEKFFISKREQVESLIKETERNVAACRIRCENIKSMSQWHAFGTNAISGDIGHSIFISADWKKANSTPIKASRVLLERWEQCDSLYDGPVRYKHCEMLLADVSDNNEWPICPEGVTAKELRSTPKHHLERKLSSDLVFACSVLNALYGTTVWMDQSDEGDRQDLEVALADWLSDGLFAIANDRYIEACNRHEIAQLDLAGTQGEWHDSLSQQEIEDFCEAFEQAYDLQVPNVGEAAMLYALLVAKS